MLQKKIVKKTGLYILISLLLLFLFNKVTFAEKLQTEDNKMTEEKELMQYHHKFAVELNGLVWNLLEKNDRTEADEDMMIQAAHASLYHWSKVGTEIHLQRGHWLISRVYSVLIRPESALYHARKCMELTEKHNFTGFDLGYAYEAMARAFAANSQKSESKRYYQLALEAAEKIPEKEDRDFFLNDLQTEPWFEMK